MKDVQMGQAQVNAPRTAALPPSLTVTIKLDDLAAINTVMAHPEGQTRDDFLRTAATLGIKMAQAAVGHVDKDLIHMEVTRLIDRLDSVLPSTTSQMLTGFQDSVKGLVQDQQNWYAKILSTVETLRGKQAERSPEAGLSFENTATQMLGSVATAFGDAVEDTSDDPGLISRCKVGDSVATLSAECGKASGTKIVFEMKDKTGLSQADILAELNTAKENRGADFGVMVMSRVAAGENAQPLVRLGDRDLLVVIDPADPSSHVFLRSAYGVARALVVRTAVKEEAAPFDLKALDHAIRKIAETTDGVGEMLTWTTTICNNGQKLKDKIAQTQQALAKQVDALNELVSQTEAGV